MTTLSLRLDVVPETKEKLLKWLPKVADAWIVAFEEHEGNPHVHLVLHCRGTEKNVRNQVVRTFGVKGNSGYSLKACYEDVSGYIRYICKGVDKETAPVIWSKQGLEYTDEAIKDAHAKFWCNNEALRENASKRRKLKENVVEEVERLCKAKGVKAYERSEVARVYISLYKTARKAINVYAGRAVINTVCLLLEGGDQEEAALAVKLSEY